MNSSDVFKCKVTAQIEIHSELVATQQLSNNFPNFSQKFANTLPSLEPRTA